MRRYTFDLKCPHCGDDTILIMTEPPPILYCAQCAAVELIITGVHVGLLVDPNDSIRLFHHVNEQRSKDYERSERTLPDATQGIRPEPAE